MKKVALHPPYIPLTQQKYCCVACALQWILLRRKLILPSQEVIAKDLGLVVPLDHQKYFVIKVKESKKKPIGGYGTDEKNGKLFQKFFLKYKISLSVKYVPYSKINNAVYLISSNLKQGNDVLFITYMSLIDPERQYGHALLAVEVAVKNEPEIVVGDPSSNFKKFYTVKLERVIEGMSKKVGKIERGLYIFSKGKSGKI